MSLATRLSLALFTTLYTLNKIKQIKKSAVRTEEIVEIDESIIANTTGPTGPIGPAGLSIVGATGIAGIDGNQGPQGFQGPQGPVGLIGNIGVQGFQGPQGQGDSTLLVPASIWTTVKTPNFNDPTFIPTRIAYGQNTFLACSSINSQLLLKSTDDGVTWDYSNFNPQDPSTDYVPVIAFGQGVFVAFSLGNNYYYTSADQGTTWTPEAQLILGSTINYTRLRYLQNANLFVVLGNINSSNAFYATASDPVNVGFNNLQTSFNNFTWYDVVFNSIDNVYYLVGQDSGGNGIIYSGTNISNVSSFVNVTPLNPPQFRTISISDDSLRMVAAGAGANGNSFAYYDRTTSSWVSVAGPLVSNNVTFESMIYESSKDVFVAVGNPGNNISTNANLQLASVYTTRDGISWSSRNASTQMQWYDIASSGMTQVAIANNSFNFGSSVYQCSVMTSPV